MVKYTLEKDAHNPIMYMIWKEVDGEDINETPGKSILAIIYRDWIVAENLVAELNGEEVIKR